MKECFARKNEGKTYLDFGGFSGEKDLRSTKMNEMEAKLAHHQLCDSIEAMDIDIVGENMSYLPKILSALAGICSKHSITVATPATIQRVKNVVQSIKSMVPIDNFNTAISQLTPKLQNLLMA